MRTDRVEDEDVMVGKLQSLEYKWVVAIAFLLGIFMDLLDMTIVNVALPQISQALHASGITASRLLIEITESTILRQSEETEHTMRTLRSLGIGVAIDDFGTGYSSLAYLKLASIEYLKIDRSFVTGLPGEGNDVAIVEAILAIAKSMGMGTIAEGIETSEQHDFLLKAGCPEGQGYLFSRPVVPAEIERMLSPQARTSPKLHLVPPKK